MKNGISKAEVFEASLDDPEVELQDTRGVKHKGRDYLSTLSHIRIARSKDGFNFTVDEKPFIFPSKGEEIYGIEDARATFVDGEYYINYTVVSSNGFSTKLGRTKDFKNVEDLGIIFCPENKDASIFPEKIGGKYYALHRPNNAGFGKPSIWCAESPDLLHWGSHKCIASPRDMYWESMKIGGGPPSIKTEEGWLQIYHGKGDGQVYSLFALLLDKNDPSKVLKRSMKPMIKPEEKYEKEGFFGNVIFTNGLVEVGEDLYIYYGACDNFTCVFTVKTKDILNSF